MAIDVGSTRKGEWMQTYSGKKFWPCDPRPEEIEIVDIASALSKMCRYGGHCLRFYSVAEHAVLCAEKVADPFKLTALLHDASEAYLVDIPRPVKPALTNYYQIEHRIMCAVAERFGIQWPLPSEVKHIDNAILTDERNQIMAGMNVISSVWGNPHPAIGVAIEGWAPDVAFAKFMEAFFRYGGSTEIKEAA